jgi:hypothetical protein
MTSYVPNRGRVKWTRSWTVLSTPKWANAPVMTVTSPNHEGIDGTN